MRGPDLPAEDPYARLELPVDAAPEAVEIAWRTLLKRHHPDVAGEGSLEAAKRINIAHDWLSDPILRARYDDTRGRHDGATAARPARPPASRPGSQGPVPRAPGGRPTPTRRATAVDEAPADLDVRSPEVVAFLERLGDLGPDEVDRLGLAEPPPLAFVASIRRFLGAGRIDALDELERLVRERLPAAARAVPAARDAATSYGQYLILGGFLADALSEPFRERVEERMTRGWLAAVGRPRYGPATAEVRAVVDRARSLAPERAERLVTAAAALGLSGSLWPAGTDPADDEVVRVSAGLAARDATEAARAAGASASAQAAIAAFARVAALAPAFGAAATGRLLRPWRELTGDPQHGPRR